jgi:hypothetical protein
MEQSIGWTSPVGRTSGRLKQFTTFSGPKCCKWVKNAIARFDLNDLLLLILVKRLVSRSTFGLIAGPHP